MDLSASLWSGKQTSLAITLRNPLKHVLSQFLHCKYSKQLDQTRPFLPNGTGVYGGLEEWVNHFVELPKDPLPSTFTFEYVVQQAYACYNPWNMQARYLTQSFTDAFQTSEIWGDMCQFECHFVSETFEPNVEIAESALADKFQFVGLTDLYVETLCLLHYKVYQEVPKTCACGGPGPLDGLTHKDHDSPEHDLAEVSNELVQTMKKLVEKDLVLFGKAVDRFEEDLAKASKETKVEMVCPDRFKQLRDDIKR